MKEQSLTEQQLQEIYHYGELQFSFEETLLSLDLADLDKDELKKAETKHKKGWLSAETAIRQTLMNKVKQGNVGAAKELIQKNRAEKKTGNPGFR